MFHKSDISMCIYNHEKYSIEKMNMKLLGLSIIILLLSSVLLAYSYATGNEKKIDTPQSGKTF